jgi:hypothetical protein
MADFSAASTIAAMARVVESEMASFVLRIVRAHNCEP